MVYILSVFSLQNAVYFIILTYLVPILLTFYIQSVLKLKKYISGAKRLRDVPWGYVPKYITNTLPSWRVVFWDVVSCSLIRRNWCFGSGCFLYRQGNKYDLSDSTL